MGYLKKPIRRSAARQSKESFLAATRGVAPAEWTREFDLRPGASDTFLRFVVGDPSNESVGPFQSSNLLADDVALPVPLRSRCRAVFRWFNIHVACPGRLPRRAVCWFRADARDCIKRVHELIELYRLGGHAVWMLSTTKPGRIVYQDEHQVAAVPFADRGASVNRA